MNRIFKNKKALKWVIIAEAIVCYMAFLTVVSYLRGPERFVAADAPLLKGTDFASFAQVPADGFDLPFWNSDQGMPVGYSAEIDLSGNHHIHVSFTVDCPAEYSGTTLHMDLYEPDFSYDSPEQEVVLTLAEGTNIADFSIDPGELAPEKAFVRVFTLDPAGYDVRGFEVGYENPLPRVDIKLWIGCIASFVLLLGTWIAYLNFDSKTFCKNAKS